MKNKLLISLAFLFTFGLLIFFNNNALGGDDPSIKGKLRTDIQSTMKNFIENKSVNNVYRHYDPVTGKLLHLKLEKLHIGIIKKGDFYVSCADFREVSTNKLVDLDFMVVDNNGKTFTSQAIVHKADGKKRVYHLESN